MSRNELIKSFLPNAVLMPLTTAAEKSILKKAFVEDARAVIIAINNEKKLILLCEILKSFEKNIKIVAKASDYDEKKLLKALEVKHIVNEGREAAKALLKVALE